MYILKISICSGPMSDERLNIQIWYQTKLYQTVVHAHEQVPLWSGLKSVSYFGYRLHNQICGSDRGTIKIWSGPNSANEGFWYHFRERLIGCASSVGCAYRLVSRRSRVRSSRPANSFVEIWSWKNFYGHYPPSADLRRVVVSYWRKNVH